MSDLLLPDGSPLWPAHLLDEPTTKLIEDVRPILEATEAEAEVERHLPQLAVDVLAAARLFKVSLPHELDGWEAELLLEVEIAEAIARIHTSACWNLTVGNYHSSLPAVFCTDDVVKEVFLGSSFPVVAGQPAAVGTAISVPGGIVVSGRYSWGSGIRHSDWVIGGCMMADDPTAIRHVWVAPKSEVNVLDNWYAFGVSGSGSSDYVVEDLFIEDGWWFELPEFGALRDASTLVSSPVLRGGVKYRVPVRLWPQSWHVGLVLGAAERAIEEIAALASRKRRRNSSTSVAEREVFRHDLATNFVAVSATRDHAFRLFAEVTACANDDRPIPLELAHNIYGLTTYASRLASSVSLMAHSYAGGDSVRLDNPLQRIMRDVLVAQQHLIYTDAHLGRLGELLIEHFADA